MCLECIQLGIMVYGKCIMVIYYKYLDIFVQFLLLYDFS